MFQTMKHAGKALGRALLIAGLPWAAQAAPMLQVTIQPIQVCDNNGANCANPTFNLFTAEVEKIWAQADISVNFLGWTTVSDSNRLNEDSFGDLGNIGDSSVIDLWFVNDLTDCGGPVNGTLFGCGTEGGWFALTKAVFDYSAVGRLDTLAHELGHVLGLGHGDFGAGGADNLMTAGSNRSIPQQLSDINPDGLGLDKLTAEQVAQARSSTYAVAAIPEPGSLPLVALAGFALWSVALRRGQRRRADLRKAGRAVPAGARACSARGGRCPQTGGECTGRGRRRRAAP